MIHSLVKELLYLYVDDTVEPEARRLIEEHLEECPECEARLMQLRTEYGLELGAQGEREPEEPATEIPPFIKRLKRLILWGTVTAVTTVIVVLIVSWYGGWSASEQRKHEADKELVRMDNDLVFLSPSQAKMFQDSGIRLEFEEKQFTREHSRIRYRYTWDHPGIDYVREDIYWPNQLVVMDLTHNKILKRLQNSSMSGYEEEVETWELEGIEADTKEVGVELPSLAVFYKPEPFQVKLDKKEILINRTIRVHNTEFNIEKVVMDRNDITVHYQQLGDIREQGLYLLTFQVKDQLGNFWSKEPHLDFQTQQHRKASIPRYAKMQEPLELQVAHGVMIIPGPHYKYSVTP